MDFGWIISGPGSTWVNKDYELVRNPHQAQIFHNPSEALERLQSQYETEMKWRLHNARELAGFKHKNRSSRSGRFLMSDS